MAAVRSARQVRTAAWGDLVQVEVAEAGEYVKAEEAAVQLVRGGGEAPLVDPLQRIRLEVDLAHVGVGPVVALDVRLGEGQPVLRVGLRREGLRGGAAAAVRGPVARLPTAGRELAGGAEFAPPLRLAGRHQAAFPKRERASRSVGTVLASMYAARTLSAMRTCLPNLA